MKTIITLLKAVVSFLEIFIVVRIIFKFLGANPATPFVRWLYQSTKPLIVPFQGIFPNIALGQRSTIDTAAIAALVVYSLVLYALITVLQNLNKN